MTIHECVQTYDRLNAISHELLDISLQLRVANINELASDVKAVGIYLATVLETPAKFNGR